MSVTSFFNKSCDIHSTDEQKQISFYVIYSVFISDWIKSKN